jgi:hypothetical protein
MIVSLALLGYGASGTYLAIFPMSPSISLANTLGWISIGQAFTILGSYLFTNLLPFDSFSIAWNPKQALLLIGQFVALALPFFFNGLGVGLLLASFPTAAGRTYAANLLGSAVGCLLALFLPSFFGVAGMMTLCTGLAASAALICFSVSIIQNPRGKGPKRFSPLLVGIGGSMLLLGFACLDLGLRFTGKESIPWTEPYLSPYKSLSYALQYPGAKVVSRTWNAFSQVDVVRSAGIRSLPGMSYRCLGQIPKQDGLLVDGDELTPILHTVEDQTFFNCLPGAVAFEIRPQPEVLVIEPRGGLDILTALNLGAAQVMAVEANPLIMKAAREIYSLPRVISVIETVRSFLHRTEDHYDIIVYTLTASFQPVRSGTFSLAEDYRYTVESFLNALQKLKPGGLLVITRWLQNPPSEDLKTFALAVTAVEKDGGNPAKQIVAFRGYNTVTILVSNQPFTLKELEIIQSFTSEKAFDLIYAQDLNEEESNIFNILPEPIYFRIYHELVQTQPRENFYQAYPYHVSPPTDDQPFFGHFFKWSQIKQVVAELGKTSQPFGGAGYLSMVGLLLLAIILAGMIILLPLTLINKRRYRPQFRLLVYYAMLGLGYLMVEIPLLQRFILYLGQPAYAMICVLFSLLFFSAFGSQVSRSTSPIISLATLAVLLVLMPIFLPAIFSTTLTLAIENRLVITILTLAPLGFLMGMPFPGGIRWLTLRGDEATIPWAWGINGAMSVIAAVLAAILATSIGFNWVLRIGALCYCVALLMVGMDYRHHSQHPVR